MFYVTKDETRVEGPWTDKDVDIDVPWDLQNIEELRPWQKTLFDATSFKELRKVDVLLNKAGNIGKTTFVRWCCVRHGHACLPPRSDFQDLLRMTMNIIDARGVAPKVIHIDMPRALKKEKMHQLWSAIETIKGGYAYDDRYSFKEKFFDPPRVIVYTNELNSETKSLLTPDRWRVWETDSKMELKLIQAESCFSDELYK